MYAACNNPASWAKLAAENNSFFSAEGWQNLLAQSFGAKSFRFIDADGNDGFSLQVFRKGPFRIGYLNFPIGGTVRGYPIKSRLDNLRSAFGSRDIHLLRAQSSGFRDPEPWDTTAVSQPETAITKLQEYDPLRIAKVRRDVARAERFMVKVAQGPDAAPPTMMYGLYKETVSRHGAALRYNAGYFEKLYRLARNDHRLKLFVARIGDELAGFLALALNCDTAYYLHGASNEKYRKNGVSDMLLYEAIKAARCAGMSCFNMMTSPPEQQALVRFKEKWGATTRTHFTYEFRFNNAYASAFDFASNTYSLLGRWFAHAR